MECKINYSISIADLEKEEDAIKKFWVENFPGWPERKYEWIYKNNIYGPAKCFLVKENINNQIVGSLAVFPKQLLVKGKVFSAGLAGDLGIAPAHRRKGLATKLRKALVQSLHDGHFDILYGTPNDKSVNTTVKVGYKVVGRPERMVKLIDSFGFLKRRLKVGLIAKLLSIPANLYLKLSSRGEKTNIDSSSNYEILTCFDDRFDKFWNLVEKNKFVTGEKTSRFLNWRFKNCTWEDFQVFVLSPKNSDDISAYLVYRLMEKEVTIVDILCENYNEMFNELLSRFIHYISSEKYEKIAYNFIGSKDIKARLKSYGFRSFPESRNLVVYTRPEFEYHNELQEINNWLFLEADSDV